MIGSLEEARHGKSKVQEGGGFDRQRQAQGDSGNALGVIPRDEGCGALTETRSS